MEKVITVFTATRAEYHLLSSVIKKIKDDPDLVLDLIVSGTHLSYKNGHTVDQIISDGYDISEEIEVIHDNEPIDVNKVIADTLLGCSKHFETIHSDMLIVLGDRYELMGCVLAAANAQVPIAHIHGGETTEGAIDEAIRHAVTKFSYLHFACCEPYRKRIIQLGENPKRVFNVGSLGVENIINCNKMSREALADNLKFNLNNFCLVTFHPVTLENNTGLLQVKELFNAIMKFDEYTYLITGSNADQGGEDINNFWRQQEKEYPEKIKYMSSLGMIRYLSAMNNCEMVIGNSSSGILEAPTFKIPTVNVGDRQKGRIKAESIIDSEPKEQDIIKAINLAKDVAFRKQILHMPQLYGDGSASVKIITEIKKSLNDGVNLKKHFYDIEC